MKGEAAAGGILLTGILVGLTAGFTARLILLTSDYRQYPSMPHNYVSHLAFGAIAAGIGAVAVPALLEGEFTAVTFLALAATQFREVRNMERETLMELEGALLVPRGADYIEGIAAVFEARNYLVMATALLPSAAAALSRSPWVGAALGVVSIAGAFMIRSGRRVGDAASVRMGELVFRGPDVYVDNIFIKNVGTGAEREAVKKYALGIIMEPLAFEDRDKLAQPGQRQAILHEVAAALGTREEIGEPELASLARKDLETGTVALFTAPVERDPDLVMTVVARAPLLEASRGSRPVKKKGTR